MGTVQDRLREYQRLVLAWDAERNPRRANRIFKQIHGVVCSLRDSQEGRRGLESLMSHKQLVLRYKAAVAGLAWKAPGAISTLESIVKLDGPYSLDAEMVLAEYCAGRLQF